MPEAEREASEARQHERNPCCTASSKRYRETKNVDDLPENTVAFPPGRRDSDFSLTGDVANWKAHEAPIPDDADLGTLEASHQKLKKAWKSSAAYDACCTLLRDTILKQESLKITSAMSLGLSSISEKHTGLYTCSSEQPMSQPVVFESWLEVLAAKHDVENVYFQDPAFHALDREFLASKGYTVLHIPEFEDVLTEETFLDSPGVLMPVLWAAIHAAHPSLYYADSLLWPFSKWMAPGREMCRPAWGYNHLPGENHHRQKLLRPFVNHRVSARLPMAKPSRPWQWLESNEVFSYKPDPDAAFRPARFQFRGEQFRTSEQAQAVWHSRGCK